MNDAPGPTPPQSPAEGRAAGRDLSVLIAVLGACGFASNFTLRLVDPIVPTLAEEFGRSIQQTAILATAFSFSYAFGQPFLGPIADSIGKLRSIAICLGGVCVAGLLATMARSFDAMLVLRAVAGIFAGGIIPAAMAAIGDRAPMAERQIALGRFLVVMIFGQMSGAAVSGVIAHHLGWQAVFVLAALLALASLVLVLVLLKPRAIADRPRLSPAAALASYRKVFANPTTIVLYALVLTEGALVFGLPPYVAAILNARSGVGSSEAGLVIGSLGLGGILYGILTRKLVKRLGPARMTTTGGLLMASAYAVFALPLPWWTAIGVFLTQGFGFFLMHGTFQAVATELAPEARGSAVALFACSLFAGHAFGPLLIGAATHLVGTTGAILFCAIGIALLGLVTPRVLPLGGSRS